MAKENLFKGLFFENTILKIMALIFAIALWFLVAGEKEIEADVLIPLEFKNIPHDMEIIDEPVREVEVRIRGSKTFLVNLSSSHFIASLDLSSAKPGVNTLKITPRDIKAPKGVEIIKVNPSTVQVYLEVMGQKSEDKR
ncbi:MAG: YbbR-like domain-containing protein [Deltaproteobacteria bacterium]|nr:YbbR-like domain-containing protein [Deltaproteobacteria bacterium]MBI3753297.1 YbbR-like domain-containing protein [Deltaproteobacteria bacterium]